jgi:hypothetical protein
MNPLVTHTGPTASFDGVDANPSRRPGIPMEYDPPHPLGHAHWSEPERTPDPGYVLKRASLAELTPVFGTAVPPRGLSGLLRRAAYRIPEHRTTHWLVLLLADRIDAIEHRPGRLFGLAVPIAIGAGLVVLTGRFGKRRGLVRRVF